MVSAKDIPDELILAQIPEWPRTISGWDVMWQLHHPWKVVLAKLRGLRKRGLIDGCPCGCRGDWTISRKES